MSHLFDLTGKTALVTGSSDGLGLAIARGLAAAGAQIVLNGRDERKLATVAKSFEAEGRRTSAKARFSPPSSISTPRASRSTSWSTTPGSSSGSRCSSSRPTNGAASSRPI
jgi:NAD(P)-dependent dehydrogenase (short-subunit alcohol dehydrogenase family)